MTSVQRRTCPARPSLRAPRLGADGLPDLQGQREALGRPCGHSHGFLGHGRSACPASSPPVALSGQWSYRRSRTSPRAQRSQSRSFFTPSLFQ